MSGVPDGTGPSTVTTQGPVPAQARWGVSWGLVWSSPGLRFAIETQEFQKYFNVSRNLSHYDSAGPTGSPPSSRPSSRKVGSSPRPCSSPTGGRWPHIVPTVLRAVLSRPPAQLSCGCTGGKGRGRRAGRLGSSQGLARRPWELVWRLLPGGGAGGKCDLSPWKCLESSLRPMGLGGSRTAQAPGTSLWHSWSPAQPRAECGLEPPPRGQAERATRPSPPADAPSCARCPPRPLGW